MSILAGAGPIPISVYVNRRIAELQAMADNYAKNSAEDPDKWPEIQHANDWYELEISYMSLIFGPDYTPTNGNYDQQMTADMRVTTKAVVGWLLMASWCYYIETTPCSLLSDQQFDKACAWLLRHYDTVEHKYKHLLPREALAAGTAYQLAMHQYPRGIIACAQQARRVLEGV